MKINIKSNKGVTITGLVIYVISFFMICAVIGVITTFFNNNTKVLSSEATASAEYDILNAYLAKEAKTEGNTVRDVNNSTVERTENGTSVNYAIEKMKFSNGNEYIFEKKVDAEYGQIYLYNTVTKKYFVVANYIQSATFFQITDGFKVEIKILEKTYTQTYNLAD